MEKKRNQSYIYLMLLGSLMLTNIDIRALDDPEQHKEEEMNAEQRNLEEKINEYSQKTQNQLLKIRALRAELSLEQERDPRVRIYPAEQRLSHQIKNEERTLENYSLTARQAREDLIKLLRKKVKKLEGRGDSYQAQLLKDQMKGIELKLSAPVQEPENPWLIYTLYASVAGTFAAVGLSGTYLYQKLFKKREPRTKKMPMPSINQLQAVSAKP